MNERIRELADQVLPNEKEFHQGDPKDWGYFFSGDELEKFAELIVKAEPVQEPYAWHYTNNAGASVWHRGPSNRLDADMQAAMDYPHVHKVTPLYTAPPQRKPLTDEPYESPYNPNPVEYQYHYPDGSWRCSNGEVINGMHPDLARSLYALKDNT